MMPSPDKRTAGDGVNTTPPGVVPLCHLVCHCQLSHSPRLTLCGLDVHGDRVVIHACLTGGCADPCLVCFDLGRLALAARRCQRCPA